MLEGGCFLMSYDQNRSQNSIITLTTRKKARRLGIAIGVFVFVSGVIGKVIEKLF